MRVSLTHENDAPLINTDYCYLCSTVVFITLLRAREIVRVKHTTQYTFKKNHLTGGGGQRMKNISLLLVVSPTTWDKRYRVEVSGASRNILPVSRSNMSMAFGWSCPGHPALGNTSKLCRTWCRLPGSNGWPTDYKSIALPTELSRH